MEEKLNITTKIPFKVSARAGKLLGRENFSNPEGAIIELVKNSYDADAKNCLVFFDIPTILKIDSNGKEYNFPIKEKSIIYIIDNGDGMTEQIIKDYWMQIGTGNKEKDFISDDKRVKTGAKGIGRFALDRLGFETEMWTLSKKAKNNSGSYWKMDWKQFDNDDKSISELSIKEAKIKIEKAKAKGQDTNLMEVDYYLKFSLPLATFFVALIAAPIGIKFAKRGSYFGVAISISIVFAWYLIYSIARSLGGNGVIQPVIAAWIQNIILGVIGILLLTFANRK